MKKIVAICLSVLMLLSAFATLTSCEEKRTLFEGNVYELSEDGESYSFASLDKSYTGTEFVVPATVNDKPVTAIGEGAFAYNFPNLTSIKLPDTITVIEINAFRDCTSLTTVNMPGTLTTIGEQAFFGCKSLVSITLPDSITSIGRQAFGDCASLTSVTFPKGITTIPENAFYDCKKLNSVIIPDSVTSIESSAFSGCSSLKTIDIPGSVTSFASNVFDHAFTSFERINYGGTKAQWMESNGASESTTWNQEIHCSDGTIKAVD